MAQPESHLITVGLYNRLSADPQLTALLPDGVWIDVAQAGPNGAVRTRFAIISVLPGVTRDVATFRRRAFEDYLYLIKAVTRDLSPITANDAAVQIAELLEDVEVPVAGYTSMTAHRLDYVEIQHADDADPKLMWQHRGGHYRVQYALV